MEARVIVTSVNRNNRNRRGVSEKMTRIRSGVRMTAKLNFPYFRVCPQIQLYGYNSELYHNMSEAQQKAQGTVGISIMVQVRSLEYCAY